MKKTEKKGGRHVMNLAVFSLAAIGVMGIYRKAKAAVSSAVSGVRGFFGRMGEE